MLPDHVVERELAHVAPVAERIAADLEQARVPEPADAVDGHVEVGGTQPDVDRQNAQLLDQLCRARLRGAESNDDLVELVALPNLNEIGDAGARLALAVLADFMENADDAHARRLAQAFGEAQARRAAGDDGDAPRRGAGGGEPTQQARPKPAG